MMRGKREMRFAKDSDGRLRMVLTVDGVPVPIIDHSSIMVDMTDEQHEEYEKEARKILRDGGIERVDASRFTVRYVSGGIEHKQTVDVCWCAGADVGGKDYSDGEDERVAAVDCTCRVCSCVHGAAVTLYLGEWS